MIEFLELCNISQKTIDKIVENNSQTLILDLSCNAKESIKIIEYMRKIGIECIDNLLIYYLRVFLMDFEDFLKKISKLNIPYFVECLNNDICTMEFIYE